MQKYEFGIKLCKPERDGHFYLCQLQENIFHGNTNTNNQSHGATSTGKQQHC
jgi:hypothetical protein